MGVHGSSIDMGWWRGVPVLNGYVTYMTQVLWVRSTTLCSSARLLLRLRRTMRHFVRSGPGLCVRLFGSPTFLWLYGTFTAASRFVLEA
jgi:hypothetical protein